jgi:hypothetical protein
MAARTAETKHEQKRRVNNWLVTHRIIFNILLLTAQLLLKAKGFSTLRTHWRTQNTQRASGLDSRCWRWCTNWNSLLPAIIFDLRSEYSGGFSSLCQCQHSQSFCWQNNLRKVFNRGDVIRCVTLKSPPNFFGTRFKSSDHSWVKLSKIQNRDWKLETKRKGNFKNKCNKFLNSNLSRNYLTEGLNVVLPSFCGVS